MSVSIPWSALLSEASYVEVTSLRLTVQPRQRVKSGTSMFESMWSSMTSSMQLAQECLQEDAKYAGNSQPLEGVELFAQTIDSILCRVKVRFIDTVIRLEHVPLDSSTGVAIEVCIKILNIQMKLD
uniref:Autophagy-related protein 2 n=1 Tax=Apis cerana TaxID=7461 RepID=V9IJJ3_APICE